MAEGIEVRHARSCVKEPCSCKPSYQAQVWSRRDKKVIKRTFPTLAAAKGWRSDASKDLRDGRMRAPTPETLREAGDTLIAGMKDGSVRKRGGEPYKPSAIRSYENSLTKRVFPDLGAVRLSDLQRRESKPWQTGSQGKGSTAPRSVTCSCLYG